MRVFKFGGASVKDAAAFRNLAGIVAGCTDKKLLVVVSAMGKTTNALEQVFDEAWRQQDYEQSLQTVKTYHLDIIKELFPDTEGEVYKQFDQQIDLLRQTLESLVPGKYDQQYDQVISFGEIISSKLLHQFLKTESLKTVWLDCRKYIHTDHTWREGKVDWAWTEKLIAKDLPEILQDNIIVTQGFIGGTNNGLTTTLGREGSDYSAAIFGYCLKAESVTIWKDVEGLLNADPKLFSDTVRFDEISYQETIEMAYYGASVIHPKTIKPLADRQIPLYVKSFLNPTGAGTKIGLTRPEKLVPAYICKQNQCLVSFGVKDFSFISEQNLGTIFNALSEFRLKINMMQNSAISFSICIDHYPDRLQQLRETLQDQFIIHYNQPLQLFTIKNYDSESIRKITTGKEILLEQRTRHTYQVVCRAVND